MKGNQLKLLWKSRKEWNKKNNNNKNNSWLVVWVLWHINLRRLFNAKFIFMKIVLFQTAVRVFANGPGDLGSVPGRVIPKTQKMVLDASLLNTQHYKGKVEPSREGVAPSPTSWCTSYRKGSLRVTLDYGRQPYFQTIQFSISSQLKCK